MRNPAFAVEVTTYRLTPRVDTSPVSTLFYSEHRSPHAAARKLASTITGTAPMEPRPVGMATKHMVRDLRTWDAYSLTDFRKHYCA